MTDDGTDTAEHLQIGAVATETGLSIKTIRHYDEVGLVVPSARSAGGFRLYTRADIDRLFVIRRMKPLGFTLAEMREVLDALANGVHGLIGIGGGIDGHVLRVFHFFAYCSSGVLSSEIYFRIY